MTLEFKKIIIKIFKNFWISFVGFYLGHLLILIFVIIQKPGDVFKHIDVWGILILTFLTSCFYGLFTIIIFYIFSLLDKRILKKRLIFGLSFCAFFILSVFNDDISFVIGFILLSLAVAVAVINIKRWIKKPI